RYQVVMSPDPRPLASAVVPMKRMNREEFFGKSAALDEERLKKALWNLYWRGSATMRERIEAELDPSPPKRASRPVVDPDAVEQVWDRLLRAEGFARFSARAATQLVRWESRYGWTRRGWGSIPEQEASLASVLARRLEVPDMWVTIADGYLDALDKTDGTR